jgi:ABC-type lipoprotein export system ATPase subunit
MNADAAPKNCVRPLMPALLEVRDLCVDYGDRSGQIRPALDGISFDIQRGEILVILGESGCGKSTLALALLGLLPSGGIVRRGNIRFDGRELLDRTERDMENVRGAQISVIFQEPSIALHPMIRVGEQVARVLRAHETLDRRKGHEKALRVLGELFSSELARIYSSYPHQLSGGQRHYVRVSLGTRDASAARKSVSEIELALIDGKDSKRWVALRQLLPDNAFQFFANAIGWKETPPSAEVQAATWAELVHEYSAQFQRKILQGDRSEAPLVPRTLLTKARLTGSFRAPCSTSIK